MDADPPHHGVKIARRNTVIPLVTSIVAVCVSFITFGWNLYKDLLARPRFKVSMAVKTIHQKGRAPEGPLIFLEGVNPGPHANRIGMPFCRKSWLKRKFLDKKNGTAFVYPDFGHYAATKASSKIEVADTATFIFPYNEGCFLSVDFAEIGVSDAFGKIHWASKRDMKKARERFLKDFPNAQPNLPA